MRCKHMLKGSDFPCRCSTSFAEICVFYEVHVHKLFCIAKRSTSTSNLAYNKFFPTNDPRKYTLVKYQHLITVDRSQNSSIPGAQPRQNLKT